MTEFALYAQLGLRHIADPAGYDHILFVAVLAVSHPPAAWRRLVWLVTAFTVGHSVTLALATLDVLRLSAALVELFIPVTILLAAVHVAWTQRRPANIRPERFMEAARHEVPRLALAALFGLVHGLGFSSFLRVLLGGEESLAVPLLAFNLGLEAGQLLILAVVVLVGVAAERVGRLSRRSWVFMVTAVAGLAALHLVVQRLPPLR